MGGPSPLTPIMWPGLDGHPPPPRGKKNHSGAAGPSDPPPLPIMPSHPQILGTPLGSPVANRLLFLLSRYSLAMTWNTRSPYDLNVWQGCPG